MPPISAPPITITLPPSRFPLRFTEMLNLRGDFDQSVMRGEVVNPKGIAYHKQRDELLVPVAPYHAALEDRVQIITAVNRSGSRARFASGYASFRGVESKLAVVPDSGPAVAAGFTPGDIFIGRGPQTEISRLSASGEVISDVWASFGPGGGFWGGLAFDTEGDFGGRLIAVEANGAIYLVSADGSSTLHVNMGIRFEGVTVAPATFGPFARRIIVSVEGYGDDDPHGGEIYALSPDGEQSLLANIGYAAEDVIFVPPLGGTFYLAQLAFDRERENRIWQVSASQFVNRAGHLLIVNEMTGELWEVIWDGERYTQQPVGRVPGRWSTPGYSVQGTELESGCFAIKRARIPDWSTWQLVPGGFTTDRAPAAASDALGRVQIFGKNLTNREVYRNRLGEPFPLAAPPNPSAVTSDPLAQGALVPGEPSLDQTLLRPDPEEEGQWRGWQRERERIITPHAPSCALHNSRIYAFAVGNNDGRVYHKYYMPGAEEQNTMAWEAVPDGAQTVLPNGNVSSATVNGRLVLGALGQDGGLYLNELAPGGRYWSGWSTLPGGSAASITTDVAPAVASFQDELYVFIKDAASQRIFMKARTPDGDWTPWSELPGGGLTNAPVTAIATEGQLFVFVTGLDQRPYANIASETGTWTGWLMLPHGGLTDTAVAPATLGNRVYLFVKGINDRQLYVRTTL